MITRFIFGVVVVMSSGGTCSVHSGMFIELDPRSESFPSLILLAKALRVHTCMNTYARGACRVLDHQLYTQERYDAQYMHEPLTYMYNINSAGR